ncbi:restriction endonuclease subunit S [Pseudoalteromonas distincta]|uniref:Type I restriction modification DNA specificity domain-containing protein n=1 Tax=Pseudoalteromonas distincta TaxID=77608 RepID=A0A4P9IZV1_9GAMM|nr:restriction endonuclease subunit S [Pseudoalteromonas distincta]QCU73824.1 hypothetical protein FFU37_04875 [Pseudoalteromonas distincta]
MSWSLVKLTEVAEVNPRLPKNIDEAQEVTFLPMASISEQGQVLEQEKRILGETRKGFTYFEKNDVVVAKITPCFENGKAAYLDCLETQIGFGTTEFHVIRADIEKLDGKYLFYLVWNKWFRHLGERNMSGSAGQKRVPSDFLKDLKIPLPPLDEQKRIAAILDKADTIRRKRQQAIQLADDFLRSVFLDMFGDPVTNSKGWEVKTISQYISDGVIMGIQDGNHGNDHPKVSDFVSNGVPFIAANVVRKGKILFDKCYYLAPYWLDKLRIGFAKPRDVLLTHKGTLGLTAVLDDSFDTYIFSPQTTYYRLDKSRILPEYLKAYFDTTCFQRLMVKEGKQSTRAYIGITRQKDLPLMLPPIAEQKKFLKAYGLAISAENKSIGSKLANEYLFNSLSQKAFAGEL